MMDIKTPHQRPRPRQKKNRLRKQRGRWDQDIEEVSKEAESENVADPQGFKDEIIERREDSTML